MTTWKFWEPFGWSLPLHANSLAKALNVCTGRLLHDELKEEWRICPWWGRLLGKWNINRGAGGTVWLPRQYRGARLVGSRLYHISVARSVLTCWPSCSIHVGVRQQLDVLLDHRFGKLLKTYYSLNSCINFPDLSDTVLLFPYSDHRYLHLDNNWEKWSCARVVCSSPGRQRGKEQHGFCRQRSPWGYRTKEDVWIIWDQEIKNNTTELIDDEKHRGIPGPCSGVVKYCCCAVHLWWSVTFIWGWHSSNSLNSHHT